MNNEPPPKNFETFLGGVFWEGWEEFYDGDPAKALAAAGYPSGPDSEASKSISELLKWIEFQSGIDDKVPIIKQFYDYQSNGMTVLEFLLRTKNFIEGGGSSF